MTVHPDWLVPDWSVPKVGALMSFVEATGKRAIICNLDEIEAALAGDAGTEIGK